MRQLCRYILAVTLLVMPFAVEAQENALMKKINAMGVVKMRYELQVDDSEGKGVASQDGILHYQAGSYKLESDGLQIISDGKSRWIYNVASEEVVISKNDYNSSNPVDNPMLLLADSSVKDNGNGSYRVIYTDRNGYHYIVKITAVTKSETHPSSFFILDESKLSDDVIITDLR